VPPRPKGNDRAGGAAGVAFSRLLRLLKVALGEFFQRTTPSLERALFLALFIISPLQLAR
jgi:hypothetical protein